MQVPRLVFSLCLFRERGRGKEEKVLEIPEESVSTAGNQKYRRGSAKGTCSCGRELVADSG
jgi:hypothetical protein